MPPTSPALAYVQAALLAGVLVVLTLQLLGGSERPQVPRAEIQQGGAEVLLEPLDRLTAILDSLSERLGAETQGNTEPRAAVESLELAQISAQLARLEQAWARRPHVGGVAHQVMDRSLPPVWDALAPVAKAVSTLKGDELTVLKRRFFFLDEAEILARFGVPTLIDVGNGREMWYYENDDENDARDVNMSVYFHQGRVVDLYSH